jgi:RNA polymerase sigma-70 factor (ECF subfamily)
VDEEKILAQRFEAHRTRLRGVAYRMLGSPSEADDAVQEAWLRLSRSDTTGVNNLAGWLTTVVARVCLDMLRARKSRHEESLHGDVPKLTVSATGSDPEQEMLLADSVGLALLVVLETLTPAERIAFVLHDMFDLPFEAIAPVVGRSPIAARQLASRARRRVRGTAVVPELELGRQRQVVDAFLAASRSGNFNALVALLDPDVVLRADRSPAGVPIEIQGASAVARQALAYAHMAPFAQPALANGMVGVIVAPDGRLSVVLEFKIKDARIADLHVITAPAHLRQLHLAVLSGRSS